MNACQSSIWVSHLPKYKESLIEHYSAGLRLSYFTHEISSDETAEVDVRALAKLLVEIVWQSGWHIDHNVSELCVPLFERLRTLTLDTEGFNKLTESKLFDFYESGFHDLFQKNEEKPLTTSSYTRLFPSILQPRKISENARRAGYPDNMKIFASHINSGASDD